MSVSVTEPLVNTSLKVVVTVGLSAGSVIVEDVTKVDEPLLTVLTTTEVAGPGLD